MSALGSKADLAATLKLIRFVPRTDIDAGCCSPRVGHEGGVLV
jgi:hypothetical protein